VNTQDFTQNDALFKKEELHVELPHPRMLLCAFDGRD
jgi:hypothetical protein